MTKITSTNRMFIINQRGQQFIVEPGVSIDLVDAQGCPFYRSEDEMNFEASKRDQVTAKHPIMRIFSYKGSVFHVEQKPDNTISGSVGSFIRNYPWPSKD